MVDDPDRLYTAPVSVEAMAARAGIVLEVAPRALGEGVVSLGGGRVLMDQAIDPGVGFEVLVTPGDQVAKNDVLGVVYALDGDGGRLGSEVIRRAVRIGEVGETVERRPLVSHRIGPEAGRPAGGPAD